MADRRQFLQISLMAGAAAALPKAAAAAPSSPWLEAEAILRRIVPPKFPARDFPIAEYGAKPGSDCSDAIARAIAACNAAGGGRVVVPEGDYLTGPIHLKSNVNLYVAKDATLRFTTDPKAYLPLVLTRWEGVEVMNYSPLIYAYEQENIAVTGEGTLDGQADNTHWWPWKGIKKFGWQEGAPEQTAGRNKLNDMGQAGVPVEQRRFGEGYYLRPNFIEPYRCKNVLIEGLTIRNAPFWEVHPVLSTNVTVKGLTIDSAGPNTDGCDPECCRDVLIEDCSFNTGDDCIAIKSGRNNDGRRVHVPTENVIIRGCHMKNGHGGVSIGSEISGGVKNVFVENCKMDSPDLGAAIRLKDNAMRGGVLEHFHFRRIAVGEVAGAVIVVDFNYEEGDKGPFKPVVRDVSVEKLVSKKSQRAFDMQGFADAPIYDIAIKDCDFEGVAEPSIVSHVEGFVLERVLVNGKPAKA